MKNQKINERHQCGDHAQAEQPELKRQVPDGDARPGDVGFENASVKHEQPGEQQKEHDEIEQPLHDNGGEGTGEGDVGFFTQQVGADELPRPCGQNPRHETHHQRRRQFPGRDILDGFDQNPPADAACHVRHFFYLITTLGKLLTIHVKFI